jgi:hypothetical protein
MNRDQVKMLAESERQMDDGETPFVMWFGNRLPVPPECMAEFGLRQGQTIGDEIVREIAKWRIAELEAKIAEKKLDEG